MILLGCNDIGPLKYLLELNDYLDDILWVENKITKKFIKNKNLVKNWKLTKPELIITGTSIGYKIDKKLIEFGKHNKIKTITIVESWGKYKERFFFNNKNFFPDHVIVNDKYSFNQAVKVNMDATKIFIGGNPILENITTDLIKKEDRNNYQSRKIKKICFISEPFKEKLKKHKSIYGFNEFDVLKDIVSCIDTKKNKLYIKSHPSDSSKKYNNIILKNKNIKLCKNLTLKKIINNFDIVIGMTSFLLIELIYSQKIVYFYTGPNSKNFIFSGLKFIKVINSIDELKKNLKTNKSKKINKTLYNFIGSKSKIIKFINSKVIH